MPAEAIARIQAVLDAEVARGAVAGGVALVAHGDAVDIATAGVRSLDGGAPMRHDDIFRIMSMTKPVTAAAAMMLVEDGRIAMSDRVDRWLPELADRRVLRRLDAALDDTVPAKRPITLDDLLTLRIGLGAVMAPPGRYPVQFAMAELGVSPGPDPISCGPDEFMARIGRLPLMHQPGEGWMYHTGADILAVLIARVAGMTLAEFLHARIFAPLGMRDTGFDVPPAAHHRLVASYTMTEAGGLQQCEPAGGGSYAQPPAFPSELVSTADDYLAFCRMLLAGGQGPQGRLLSSEHVRMMVTDHITPAQKAASPFFPGFWDRYGWGFGGAVTAAGGGPGHPGSYGWMGGFGTSMLVDPAARMTTIVMIQRLMRCPADAALAAAIQAAAYATRCP